MLNPNVPNNEREKRENKLTSTLEGKKFTSHVFSSMIDWFRIRFGKGKIQLGQV